MDIIYSFRKSTQPLGDLSLSDGTFLEVNGCDNTLNLFKDGAIVQLIKQITLNDIGSSTFTLKLPLSDGKLFTIQGGSATVNADSSVTKTLNESFTTKFYGVLTTHTSNDPPVTIMAAPIDLNSFALAIKGGISTENVFWIAFGY